MSVAEVLLLTEEVRPHNLMGLRYFDIPAIDEILERKRSQMPTIYGVKEAVKLILTQCATVIRFVDIGNPVDSPFPDEDSQVYKTGLQLAFNDHMGGSESAFKILVNRHTEDAEPAQYVLYSPPQEEGSPSNNVFHHSNFTFIESGADGLDYANHVPNALKTAGAVGYRGGDRDHEYFVFGNEQTPFRFSKLFENIGFVFEEQPYSYDQSNDLRHLENQARDRLDFTEMHHWPGEQFAGQLAVLEATEL
ncbi:MAG TPA: hypothetical protein VJJ78_03410 [Candidatus Saccharimonadales bacterium]|nr:hypothetical protein [Candidatus Saccharimonadales bacterium]